MAPYPLCTPPIDGNNKSRCSRMKNLMQFWVMVCNNLKKMAFTMDERVVDNHF
ncbi:hypothetical protein Hanom_Chr12g01089441 [Helianthus anomalus]